MILLQSVTCILLIISFIACAYYYFLLAVKFGNNPSKKTQSDTKTKHRFAIIIPAYNEEKSIVETIEFCHKLDYPDDRYSIFVIADNCTDDTGALAQASGATVLERRDKQKRGKGYALEYAFTKLLDMHFDAYLVLDADCEIDSDVLTVLSACLDRNGMVIQLDNRVSNPDSCALAYALAVGNYIENQFFYVPKSRLGLAVLLRGTGMMFAHQVLEKIPWAAFSETEDIEYGIELLRSGYRVSFLGESGVSSPFPVTIEQLNVQRSRWAQGNMGFGKRQALKLMLKGIASRNLRLIDAGLTFLVISKPLVLATVILTALVAWVTSIVSPTLLGAVLFMSSIMLMVLIVLYFLIGILSFGVTTQRVKYLLGSPIAIAKLILISVRGLLSKSNEEWKRTPR